MKKFSFLMLAAIAACIACKEKPEPEPGPGPVETETKITATAPMIAAPLVPKAALAEDQAQWAPGDQLAVFLSSGEAEVFTLEEKTPVTTGTFVSSKTGLELSGFAAYPATATSSKGKISIPVPAEFAYGAIPLPMVGAESKADEESGYKFSFATGFIGLSYSNMPEGVSKIVITSSADLSGTLVVDAISAVLSSEGAGKVITVSGIPATSGYILIPAPAGSHSLVIDFFNDTEKVFSSTQEVEVEQGIKSSLSPIGYEEAPTSYIAKIAHLWIWGGTGPQYYCSKLYDLFADSPDKASNFDNTDGRGPKALKDNYLEIGLDGTFTNWAGEDGRNWWYVYLQEGKKIDVSKFYDLLPNSTATWAVDQSTGVVTLAVGEKTVTASLMEPGAYDLPNTTPVKKITLNGPAIAFSITGGQDYWDNAASDLDVFVKNPRAMFVELEIQANDFVIPAAAKTTDTENVYVEPEDPGDPAPFILESAGASINPQDILAKWVVYGNTSEGGPRGILVLGGSGDDPKLVSPCDKSWDWGNTVYYEYDNGLVVRMTGATATEVTGTINWWAGNDGKWWDYKWRFQKEGFPQYEPYYETDLSAIYSKIPKGQHPFTLDLATLTATLSNNEKAQLLTPGTYKFLDGDKAQRFTVPDGCWAMKFHLGNMKPANTDGFKDKDIDRFMFCPLEYIIIFKYSAPLS